MNQMETINALSALRIAGKRVQGLNAARNLIGKAKVLRGLRGLELQRQAEKEIKQAAVVEKLAVVERRAKTAREIAVEERFEMELAEAA